MAENDYIEQLKNDPVTALSEIAVLLLHLEEAKKSGLTTVDELITNLKSVQRELEDSL